MGSSNTMFWVVFVMLTNNLVIIPVFSNAIGYDNEFTNNNNIITPVPQGLPPKSGVRGGRIESNPPLVLKNTKRFFPNDPNENRVDNEFTDEKNYYSSPADPHVVPTLSSGSHHRGTPHRSHTPGSGGSGSGYYPSPTPLVPSPPIGGGGSGSYTPPSGGGCTCSPPPSSGGGSGSGGYYPPTTPVSPTITLVPSPPYITPTPIITPIVPSPPLFPISPPTPFDPNTPLPCTYWGNHPSLIFGALGWFATLGGIFGVATLPGLGASTSSTSLQQVLKNPRNDPYSALYREGTASYLNSVATKNFYFSPNQVKDTFLSSLASEKAAARQARLFKLANEGKLKKTN